MEEPKKAAVVPKKRRWIRRVLVISGIILGALVIAGMILLLTLDLLVASLIRKVGPMVTKTPCQVKSVRIYPFRGRVEVDGLLIGNPPGFSRPELFRLERFVIDVDMDTVTSLRKLISEVRVDGMDVDYEPTFDGRGSNVAVVQKNIENFLNKTIGKPAADTVTPPAENPDADVEAAENQQEKLVIQLLDIGRVRLCSGALVLPLPGITMHDLGDDDEKSWADITNDFFNVLINNAVMESGKAGVKLIGAGVMSGVDATGKVLGSGVDASGKVVSATGDTVADVAGTAKDGVQNVVGKVKNLFSK